MPVCSDEHLNAHWVLNDDELGLLKGKSDLGRLTLCILLKPYQFHGHFPKDWRRFPRLSSTFLPSRSAHLPIFWIWRRRVRIG